MSHIVDIYMRLTSVFCKELSLISESIFKEKKMKALCIMYKRSIFINYRPNHSNQDTALLDCVSQPSITQVTPRPLPFAVSVLPNLILHLSPFLWPLVTRPPQPQPACSSTLSSVRSHLCLESPSWTESGSDINSHQCLQDFPDTQWTFHRTLTNCAVANALQLIFIC